MTSSIPHEIKLAYIITIVVMLLLVMFIVMVVVIYNKRQLFYLKEKELREAEFQNKLLQEQLGKQQAIHKERERIALDMHDELGAGISALKLQAEFLKQRVSDEKVQGDIGELSEITDAMNRSMREMLWSLNSDNDNLQNLVTFICSYIESFFSKTNIRFHCNTTEIYTPDTAITAVQRRNILLCIKEAANNIYKHSQAQIAELSFIQENTFLTITVKDDGVGMSSKSSTGNGLKNMNKRMVQIGGTLQMLPSEKGLMLQFQCPVG